ncbi:MAG: addiction module toxin, HicA family [Synechococcaceae bacterium WB4_2_0805]|nr:addiction module toxin, HicA family [Synechococcaceae bacterium WB4_2_0805]
MDKYSAVSGKELIAAFTKIGFVVTRIRGSHHIIKHPDGRTTVIPSHAGESIGPGLLANILRSLKITRSELEDLL